MLLCGKGVIAVTLSRGIDSKSWTTCPPVETRSPCRSASEASAKRSRGPENQHSLPTPSPTPSRRFDDSADDDDYRYTPSEVAAFDKKFQQPLLHSRDAEPLAGLELSACIHQPECVVMIIPRDKFDRLHTRTGNGCRPVSIDQPFPQKI